MGNGRCVLRDLAIQSLREILSTEARYTNYFVTLICCARTVTSWERSLHLQVRVGYLPRLCRWAPHPQQECSTSTVTVGSWVFHRVSFARMLASSFRLLLTVASCYHHACVLACCVCVFLLRCYLSRVFNASVSVSTVASTLMSSRPFTFE